MGKRKTIYESTLDQGITKRIFLKMCAVLAAINLHVKYNGFAPFTAISFTVPATASFPIEPLASK